MQTATPNKTIVMTLARRQELAMRLINEVLRQPVGTHGADQRAARDLALDLRSILLSAGEIVDTPPTPSDVE